MVVPTKIRSFRFKAYRRVKREKKRRARREGTKGKAMDFMEKLLAVLSASRQGGPTTSIVQSSGSDLSRQSRDSGSASNKIDVKPDIRIINKPGAPTYNVPNYPQPPQPPQQGPHSEVRRIPKLKREIQSQKPPDRGPGEPPPPGRSQEFQPLRNAQYEAAMLELHKNTKALQDQMKHQEIQMSHINKQKKDEDPDPSLSILAEVMRTQEIAKTVEQHYNKTLVMVAGESSARAKAIEDQKKYMLSEMERKLAIINSQASARQAEGKKPNINIKPLQREMKQLRDQLASDTQKLKSTEADLKMVRDGAARLERQLADTSALTQDTAKKLADRGQADEQFQAAVERDLDQTQANVQILASVAQQANAGLVNTAARVDAAGELLAATKRAAEANINKMSATMMNLQQKLMESTLPPLPSEGVQPMVQTISTPGVAEFEEPERVGYQPPPPTEQEPERPTSTRQPPPPPPSAPSITVVPSVVSQPERVTVPIDEIRRRHDAVQMRKRKEEIGVPRVQLQKEPVKVAQRRLERISVVREKKKLEKQAETKTGRELALEQIEAIKKEVREKVKMPVDPPPTMEQLAESKSARLKDEVDTNKLIDEYIEDPATYGRLMQIQRQKLKLKKASAAFDKNDASTRQYERLLTRVDIALDNFREKPTEQTEKRKEREREYYVEPVVQDIEYEDPVKGDVVATAAATNPYASSSSSSSSLPATEVPETVELFKSKESSAPSAPERAVVAALERAAKTAFPKDEGEGQLSESQQASKAALATELTDTNAPVEQFAEGNAKSRELNKKGLSDTQIKTLINKTGGKARDYIQGVYPYDKLPGLKLSHNKPTGFIVNTDPTSMPGRHWVSLYIDPRESSASVEYFDSFGKPPTPSMNKAINKMIKQNFAHLPYMLKYKINSVKNQSATSPNCGFFAIKFLTDRINKGKKFDDATGYKRQSQVAKGEHGIALMKKSFGYI